MSNKPPMDPITESILMEAYVLTNSARNEDYGHPLDDFTKTAKMWEQILGVLVSPEQVALCMICVKLSRETNRPKRDNLVDIAGYARTIEMLQNERIRREDATSDFGPLPKPVPKHLPMGDFEEVPAAPSAVPAKRPPSL